MNKEFLVVIPARLESSRLEKKLLKDKEIENVGDEEEREKEEESKEIEENLNSQIYMYIQSDSLYKSQIEDYKKQLKIKNRKR